MITREEALAIVREYVKNENLVRHMLAVEAAVRWYARKLGEDEDRWGLVALLHDFDWEIHPDLEGHPTNGAPILRERGVDEEIIEDILSHADHTGVPRDTPLRKALAACDELTGLITATALVRPSKAIQDVQVKSVKKKWKVPALPPAPTETKWTNPSKPLGWRNGSMSATYSKPCRGLPKIWGWRGDRPFHTTT